MRIPQGLTLGAAGFAATVLLATCVGAQTPAGDKPAAVTAPPPPAAAAPAAGTNALDVAKLQTERMDLMRKLREASQKAADVRRKALEDSPELAAKMKQVEDLDAQLRLLREELRVAVDESPALKESKKEQDQAIMRLREIDQQMRSLMPAGQPRPQPPGARGLGGIVAPPIAPAPIAPAPVPPPPQPAAPKPTP